MRARLFRIKVGATNDGTTAPTAGARDELVVEEEVAAFLMGQRAAEIIEVIESPDGEAPAE
jgi:hypothetical protein